MATDCLLGFYFCILLEPAFVQISYKNSLRRDPRSSFFAFVLQRFSDPRVYRSPMYLCSEVFFLQRKKVRSKDLKRYAACGLPQGPAFACTLTISNETKKQKSKKHKFCLGFLYQINIFAHAVKTQNVSFT